MACNITVPMAEITQVVREALEKEFIKKDNPRIERGVFTNPTIRGGITLDTTTVDSISDALADNILDMVVAENAIQTGKIDIKLDNLGGRIDNLIEKHDAETDAISESVTDLASVVDARDDSLNQRVDNIDAAYKAADQKVMSDLRGELKIVSITRSGNDITIETGDGTKHTFDVLDPKFNDGRAVDFITKSDTIEIVLSDGTVLDLTHKELTDWLAGKASALATDNELRQLEARIEALEATVYGSELR